MSWKSTPAMAGERCIVDKVQITANDESHHSVKVGKYVCVYCGGRVQGQGGAEQETPVADGWIWVAEVQISDLGG